jgi:hypothetical protein
MRKWTPAEEKILIDTVHANRAPGGNTKFGFKAASEALHKAFPNNEPWSPAQCLSKYNRVCFHHYFND